MKFQLALSTDKINDIPIIVLDGDLTSEGEPELKNLFLEIKEKSPLAKLIINFERLKYLNSSGIASLINIIHQVNQTGGNVAFVGLSPHILNVLSVVGVTDFVKIFKTNSEAASS